MLAIVRQRFAELNSGMEGESGKSNRVVMPHCAPMLMRKRPVNPVDLAHYFFPENGRES
jgi:hypothetical protein